MVDPDSGEVLACSNREVIDESARQTLTQPEIEALKRDGTAAGKDIIAKLMLSHTALDQKTSFSLAKYKILKTKKYIRRFQVRPLDVASFGKWMLDEKDASRILDMREEMLSLVGCMGNVHYGGEDIFLGGDIATNGPATDQALLDEIHTGAGPSMTGRWMVIDDTSGFLVAAMAERMGILYPEEATEEHSSAMVADGENGNAATSTRRSDGVDADANATSQPGGMVVDREDPATEGALSQSTSGTSLPKQHTRQKSQQPRPSDFRIPYSQTNTLTLIHSSNQPNLSFLNYYNFDANNPNHPPHPMVTHLLPLSWLQLIDPSLDTAYSTPPPVFPPDEVATWKPNRRGNYHRKRRRYARTRHIVDAARAGGFSGLVCASTMDAVGILRHTLPLLAGGAPVVIYSASPEPLIELSDCFSVGRRTAWPAHAQAAGLSAEEAERWPGSDEFPVNPTLLLGASIQTSRVRRWQVLPARTHPLMTERGGAEGYVFTGWRARPAEGKVEARGKYKRRRKEENPDPESL